MQREAAQALQRKRGQESMEQVHQQRFTEQESQHDACGIGAVVNISGQRTHRAVDDALKIVEKLEHRTGKDADGTTGDGVGIMTQLPYAFFEKNSAAGGKTASGSGRLRRRHDLFSAGSAQTYAQPKAAGDDPVA